MQPYLHLTSRSRAGAQTRAAENGVGGLNEPWDTALRIRGVLLLCAPTILGVMVSSVAQAFRPGPQMPLETAADRFFVELFVWGVPLSLLGLPLVLLALVNGVRLIWKEGLRSTTGKLVVLILAIAVAASSYVVTKTVKS